MENIKYLVKEGYLEESGKLSPNYTFFESEIYWKKDIEDIVYVEHKMKALLGSKKFRKYSEENNLFLDKVQKYHLLQPSFETGDFLRHVAIIRQKKKHNDLLNGYSLECFL